MFDVNCVCRFYQICLSVCAAFALLGAVVHCETQIQCSDLVSLGRHVCVKMVL